MGGPTFPLALLWLGLCSSVAVWEKLEYDGRSPLTCGQALSDCRVTDEMLGRSVSDPVNVTHVELKTLLCCIGGRECVPCLQVKVQLSLTENAFLYEYHSGGEDEDEEEEVSGEDAPLSLRAAASLRIYFSVPHTIAPWKRLDFTLSPAAVEEYSQCETWLSLVLTKNVYFDSEVEVLSPSFPTQRAVIPSRKDVCSSQLEADVKGCEAPQIKTLVDLEKGVLTLQLEKEDVKHSIPVRLCMIYREEGKCAYQQLNSTEVTIPLSSVAPCLCFQWWLGSESESLRREVCPFRNRTEFLHNVWNNISVSVTAIQTNDDKAALAWSVSAPCWLDAELWLCRSAGGEAEACREVMGTRRSLQVEQQERGFFTDIEPHPSLCVQGKVNGRHGKLGPFCPYARGRTHWSLLALAIVLFLCVAILGTYLLQGSLKRLARRWIKDSDVKGALGGSQVVLLYPSDPEPSLPGLVCRLGYLLSELGFSVSLDLWSRAELGALGPVPWLHSRLDRLRRHGGKAVLLLTRGGWEQAENWLDGAEGRRDDVFSASLSCVLADCLQGRAGERFVLARFESLPPLPLGAGRALPELFCGLPLYSLPSQSLGFLSELAGKRGGRDLRVGSRTLAVGLRGLGHSWETLPLQSHCTDWV